MSRPDFKKKRGIAAAALRDGASNGEAARAAGVTKRTVIKWKAEAREQSGEPTDIPGAGAPIPTPEAVLRGLLYADNERIRLDAARSLVALNLDAGDASETPEYETTVYHDLQPGEQPRAELHVWN
jgi:transposase-like protein